MQVPFLLNLNKFTKFAAFFIVNFEHVPVIESPKILQ